MEHKAPHLPSLAERRTERIRRYELRLKVLPAIYTGLMRNKHHKNVTARMHDAVGDEVFKILPGVFDYERVEYRNRPVVHFNGYEVQVWGTDDPALDYSGSRVTLYYLAEYGKRKETWQEQVEESYAAKKKIWEEEIAEEKLLALNDKALHHLADQVKTLQSKAYYLLVNSGLEIDEKYPGKGLQYDHPLLFGHVKERNRSDL